MPNPTFNWRDYITVSDNITVLDKFSPADKALIEKALDAIAATGPDGEKLIKTALANHLANQKTDPVAEILYHRYDRDKIEICTVLEGGGILTLGQGSHINQSLAPGRLPFDMEQIKMLYVDTPEGEKHVSLVAVLVHELFHFADFNTRPDVLRAQATAQGGPDKKIDKDVTEQDATHYTDVFMAKHFPSEPWRGIYENGHYGKAVTLTVTSPGCGVYKPGVYDPKEMSLGDLGCLQQPTISTQPSDACAVIPVNGR